MTTQTLEIDRGSGRHRKLPARRQRTAEELEADNTGLRRSLKKARDKVDELYARLSAQDSELRRIRERLHKSIERSRG